ncbi:hypothetical protein N9K16_06390 [Alphaproteobacteria bacterium]|jgi:hypothetical protein|nr:hypothetical protein [Alphaproteobacteria bacterium]
MTTRQITKTATFTFLGFLSLFMSACGGGPTTVTNKVATSLDLSVVGEIDRKLSASEIRSLLVGKTVTTRNLNDPGKIQIGTFSAGGGLSVSASGQSFDGKWVISADQICYDLGARSICSSIHQSEYSYAGKPVHYFRRRSEPNIGQPTVVIISSSTL